MKFLIYKRDGDLIGEFLDSYDSSFKDDTSSNRSQERAEPKCIHIECPENLDPDLVKPEFMELSSEQVVTLREPIEGVAGQEEIVDMETGEVLQFYVQEVEAQEGLYQTIPAVFGWGLVLDPVKVSAKAANDALASQRYVEAAYDKTLAFGAALLKEFTVQNVLMGISADQMTGDVLSAMSKTILAINTTSLKDAIKEAKAIPEEAKDGKYVTDARLLSFINKIETFLGLPLSTDME